MIAEAVRRSKEQSNGLMQDDARQEEATYAAALVGFTRDEHGDDLIFIIDEMGAAEYGSYDTLGDLADPLKDWIVNSADVIDDLASNSCGLLFDLNSQEPFAWFEVWVCRKRTLLRGRGSVDPVLYDAGALALRPSHT